MVNRNKFIRFELNWRHGHLGVVLLIAVYPHFLWAQSFDFYEPAVKTKAPVLIYVHGGAWIGGSKEQYKFLARSLTQQGLCVVISEYRLAPTDPHPRQVQDLQWVIQRMLKRIARLKSPKCDPQKIYLVGHSAGAHTVAFWASVHSQPRVRGFIGIEGIYDIPDLIEKSPQYKDRFISSEFGDPELWAEASPTRRTMKNKAPWLVIHSKKDEVVDPAQSLEFTKSLRVQGIRSRLFRLGTQTHYGALELIEDPESELAKVILNFVKKGKL